MTESPVVPWRTDPGSRWLAALGCFVALACPVRSAEQPQVKPLTQPKRLFEIHYGSTPAAVGLVPIIAGEGDLTLGPTGFAVDDGGRCYVADDVNRRVQVYSASGDLVRSIPSPLNRTDVLAVSPSGAVLLIEAGLTPKAAAFDDEGRTMEERARAVLEVMRSSHPRFTPMEAFLDGQGKAYVGGVKGGRLIMLAVGGQPVPRELPYGLVDDTGNIYVRRRLADRRFRKRVYGEAGQLLAEYEAPAFTHYQVTVQRQTGELLAQYRLPGESLPPLEQTLSSFSDARLDGQGCLYGLCSGAEIRHRTVRPGLTVSGPDIVLQYGRAGARIGVRAIIESLSLERARHYWDVDPHGNVYWLDFKTDHADVMMAPAPKSRRGAGKR